MRTTLREGAVRMRIQTLAWGILAAVAATTSATAQPATVQAAVHARQAEYGRLPLTFEMNQGQTSSEVKFLSRGRGYTAFLTAGRLVLSLRASTPTTGLVSAGEGAGSATVQLILVGAAKNPTVVGEDQQPGRVNYFLGKDPAKWHTSVPTYGRVRYKNVYPGTDLVYRGNHRQLEYDFEILPGADPDRIQFAIQDADEVRVDSEGNLVLKKGSVELHFQSPVVYQIFKGQRIAVDGGYVVTDSTHVSFRVAAYDPKKPLVIDPALVYSTYLGGSGYDQPSGIVVDSAGSVYIAGYTNSSDFPLATLGSLPTSTYHAFLAKLDPSGSNLVYADYIGGSGPDYGYALVLDSMNDVWVAGSTQSSDFPVVNAYQATQPGHYNAFLSKISAAGSSLLYSTYLGGNGADQPSGVSIDSLGNIYVAGATSSENFPVANAYQATMSPNQGGLYGAYGFLTKFSPDGSSLVYSTFLGGNSNVAQSCGQSTCWPMPYNVTAGVAVDANGNAYVSGDTNTYNFPTTQGAYLTTDSAPLDTIVGFVSKFTSSGNLDYSTYFYGSSGASAEIAAITADSNGSAYITGYAQSDGTFPITSTGICDPSVYFAGCSYAFVTKFDPTGSYLMYSTFLGPYNDAYPQAIVLDANNDAYVSCVESGSSSFTTVNGIESYTGDNDLLVTEIDPGATTELFATFLGGTADEYPFGLALDARGDLYVVGQTFSTDFPITQAAFQTTSGGNSDAFVLKIEPQSAPAFSASAFLLQYSTQTVGQTSQPQSVAIRNMGSAAMSISSITPTGDFAETDSCSGGIQASASCTLTVTFTPTAVGTRSGSITFQDNAGGSPHIINLEGDGSAAVATLSPASLVFSAQAVATSSVAQTVTLTNTGNATLNVSNIQITGDFTQSNNCPAALASNSSCTVNVTFTPTVTGSRSGTLTISDSAQGSPQLVNLSGTGLAPIATISLATLTFPVQQVGTSSAAQVVTLTSSGSAALSISNIQSTGDYAQTNTCPAALAAGFSCTINVTFTPTAYGTRNGTLTISDNAQGSPQVVNLAGAGADFSISSSPSSDTVKAGATAAYQMTVSPLGGAFTNIVKLSCSGAPALTTCKVSPNAVTPNGSVVTAALTITTTASVANAVPLRSSRDRTIYAVCMPGISLFGMILMGSGPRSRKFRMILLLALMTAALMFMIGCAGGTGITTPPQSGTTPGTYTITVTGTSGALQHSNPVSLIVQ